MTGRILVTGSTGFVGRAVVSRLVADRHPLTLTLRRRDGPPTLADGYSGDVRTVVTGPIEDAEDLSTLLRDVDRIVHLAGFAHIVSGDAYEADSAVVRANEHATARLTEAARAAGVRTFVHMSSLAAVAPNAVERQLDDSCEPRPTTAYGRAKLAAERHVGGLAVGGTMAVSLRPPLIVGPAAKGNLGLLLRAAASGWPLPLASLTGKRSMLALDTLVEAIVRLVTLNADPALSGAYAVAERQSVTVGETIAALRKGMNLPPRLVSAPPGLLAGMGRLAGREQQVRALTGNLVVDASRFRERFLPERTSDLPKALERCGATYLANRKAHGGKPIRGA